MMNVTAFEGCQASAATGGAAIAIADAAPAAASSTDFVQRSCACFDMFPLLAVSTGFSL
jgi:hypothetical protein